MAKELADWLQAIGLEQYLTAFVDSVFDMSVLVDLTESDLHALGVPGAHVVVRNPERERALPEATLRQAATLAAWFSDAREQTAADVQWTRRRFVRRARGRPPGTVLVKRAQTLRVVPREPA